MTADVTFVGGTDRVVIERGAAAADHGLKVAGIRVVGPQAAVVAALTGTLTGTANGSMVDVAAAAGACAGSAEPSAAQVDTAIATAVATIVSGVNEQLKELQTRSNAVLAILKTHGLIASA